MAIATELWPHQSDALLAIHHVGSPFYAIDQRPRSIGNPHDKRQLVKQRNEPMHGKRT